MNTYQLYTIGKIFGIEDGMFVSVYEEYKSALLHIDKFSHIILFYIELTENKSDNLNFTIEERKQAIKNIQQYSLTQIKIAVVKVLSIDNKQGVIRIDCAISCCGDLVDIKPYFPIEDRIKECIVSNDLASFPSFIQYNSINNDTNCQSLPDNLSSLKTNNLLHELNSTGVIRKTGGLCVIEFEMIDESIIKYFSQFSHIQIFWWFSRFEKETFRKTRECNPPYENAPRTGVFASRSPVRPNPIGLTTARILNINTKRKSIEISIVDAFDKTPVLDIKPYIPFLHRVEKCNVPSWVDHWSEWYIEQASTSAKGKNISLSESDFQRISGLMSVVEIPKTIDIRAMIEKKIDNTSQDLIIIKGAKENNLKNISLTIPKNKITVITGLSGSGKSSLAFDTIFSESQRRFMDNISSTGRQFFKQFERPNVDQISNLPPAIAVEQKSINRNIRSTVGTVSGINDFLRLLYARIGIRHCPDCGRAIEVKTAHEITNLLTNLNETAFFNIVSLKNNQIVFSNHHQNTINNSIDSIESLKNTIKQLLENESGAFKVELSEGYSFILHTRNHCYYCGNSFFELTPSFFSNNNPDSMCSECDGLGTKMSVSPELIVAYPEKSILDGASDWWGDLRKFSDKPTGNWMKGEVIALAQSMKVDLEIPWNRLPDNFKHRALFGTDGESVQLIYKGSKGRSGEINRPVEGAVNNIKRLFRGSHGKNSSDFYLQFMSECECPSCHGEQLNSEARFVTIADMRFPEISSMTITALHDWIQKLPAKLDDNQFLISRETIASITHKTEALNNVGLGYLSLKRSLPTLSGGECQRLRLSSQLGSGLTNLLYILDEPSIGLHSSDQIKLINTLKNLRDCGNTLIIVEHDKTAMLEADYLIDIGPGAGINGGHLVAQGTPKGIMENDASITGKYLSHKLRIGTNLKKMKRTPYGYLEINGACKNNLKDISVSIPLGVFTCFTGKSGSGKSSLVTKTLSPILTYYYNHKVLLKGDYKEIKGLEQIDNVITITQEAIGRTPRSNPATYTGVFDEIRNIFAITPHALEKGFTPNRFSFNSKDGRCNSCKGEGRTKIEMNFMPDVWITCPECMGKRFNKETLQVTYKNKTITDILEMDIDEASIIFEDNKKVAQILNTLKDVGLGYLKLGQSASTLSGGEAQRIKLSKELSNLKKGKTLYILDEPTTGLHFSDIEHLLTLIHKIIEDGNTVIVIEHNNEMVNNADWMIELGPEGGEKGGYIIYEGKPYKH
jgi:excinuclease ABC subunit A